MSSTGAVASHATSPARSDLIALASVITGGWATARAQGRLAMGRARDGAIVALVLAVIGMALAALHLATSTGAVGTGNGRGGAIVGYLHFGVGARGPHLFRIYADPIAYGSGVGSVLLDELHRRLDERGIGSYELEVHERNERGRAFYDRKGFVIVDVPTTSPGWELTLRRTLHPRIPSLPAATDRLVLRPLTADDAEALHRIYGDAETMAHIGRTRRPTADLEATARVVAWAERHAEQHGFSMWALD